MRIIGETFLSYAFRPFFLFNGIFAIIAMIAWIAAWHGARTPAFPLDSTMWHGHEMVVGFAMATIAGFVLTAVATWTGRPPIGGMRLALLVLAWLVGRLAMSVAELLPAAVLTTLDMVFPLLLCWFVGQEVFGGKSRRNFPIVVITAVLALLNLVYHIGEQRLALYLLIHMVLLLITVIAGRIVPNFTANWLRGHGSERLPASSALIDGLTLSATAVVGVSASFAPMSPVTGVVAFAAACVHAVRLSRWCGLATTVEPLLFVLHVAYLWLPVGYALLGCAALGWVFPHTAALHALTMGGIGSMILAVTTRVALGHTGRALHAARLTVVAYCVFTVAVVLRVLSPLSSGAYGTMIDLAAGGWIISFAIFVWVYWPVLTGESLDTA